MSLSTPSGGSSTPKLSNNTPSKSSTSSNNTPNTSTNSAKPSDSIILEEEIDPNYVPSEDEVTEYAKWLGMDLATDEKLFWIAREGLKAPLPEVSEYFL